MKRTTISLPDDLAVVAERESRRRGISLSAFVRETLRESLQGNRKGRQVPFAAVGHSGDASGAARAEELLAETWADDIEADRG